MLLCTDGLWGEIPGEAMATALWGANIVNTVPALLLQAEAKGGPHVDNLSVVAVHWEDNYVDQASSISTQTMRFDEIATHIEEFGRDPAHKSDLSEDEIELAIEEIRAAIDKFNPRKQGQ